MASWVAVDMDDTLVDKHTGVATPGAAEAMQSLLDQGHRVSIWTARFSHARDEEHSNAIKKQVEHELALNKIPYSDVWTGHVKPDVDAFVGDNLIPYAGNWPQSLSMLHMYLGKPAEGHNEPSEDE